MRLIRASFLFLCGLLIFSGSALAFMIPGTPNRIDVGSVDSIYRAVAGGSPSAEVSLIKSLLPGGDYVVGDSYTPAWTQTIDDPSVYALDLGGKAGYFLIWLAPNPKNPSSVNAFLYRNLENYGYAVVDIDEWKYRGYDPPGNGGSNIGRISHLRQVSEPATMLLLGFCLIGLAAFGRKRFFRRA